MERVQGSWNLSHEEQHSLKVFHNALMYSRHGIVFLFFFVDRLDSSFLSPASTLSPTISAYPSLFHTPLTSPSTVFIFSLYLNSIFNLNLCFLLRFSQFFSSRLSTSLWHVSSFTHFLFTPSLSLHFSSPTRSPYLVFFTDASISGGVCSKYLKPHLPFPLRPTCPSCSMWRSRTLEPQFWAP